MTRRLDQDPVEGCTTGEPAVLDATLGRSSSCGT
jgi:hypothetical protein